MLDETVIKTSPNLLKNSNLYLQEIQQNSNIQTERTLYLSQSPQTIKINTTKTTLNTARERQLTMSERLLTKDLCIHLKPLRPESPWMTNSKC
jgi:hypothetical protein